MTAQVLKKARPRTANSGRDGLVPAFAATLFCSALLMFAVQPLMGKLLLPRLGGTPQIWNTCMVFFQAVLFAGYLHAHYSGMLFGLRRQAQVHVALGCLALLALPIGSAAVTATPDMTHPVSWIMLTLLASAGAPMLVICSTAPLLQRWFSCTSHPAAHDPYFLYAASNLGSLAALLGYPLFIEPWIDVQGQIFLVSAGFAALVFAVGFCTLIFLRDAAERNPVWTGTATEGGTIEGRQKLRWLLLSFVPSSLLLGVTTHITTDLASVPLFWIVPLALYLLTFVIAFARRPLISHGSALRAQASVVALLVVILCAPMLARMPVMLIVHLLAFFATALVCHGELFRTRPSPEHLTGFYLFVSFGGVLGGAFNALLAPLLFSEPLEYPLALVLACALRPRAGSRQRRERALDVWLPLALLGVTLLAFWSVGTLKGESAESWRFAVLVGIMVAVGMALLAFSERPLRFALGVAAALAAGSFLASSLAERHRGEVSRSFFGVYKVGYDARLDATVLTHGTTIHGAQSRDPARAGQPVHYYHTEGPFGDLFRALGAKLEKANVAVVGLGTGALACYGASGSTWTFYEIDPLVERIARDARYFTYVRDCAPRKSIIIGDARLTLSAAPAGHYAAIVIDAFSSDAIPTHLLTREALAGYLAKLAPDGVLAIHISNRYMALEPVVASLARDAALAGRINRHGSAVGTRDRLAHPAQLTVLARNADHLGPIATAAAWRPLAARAGERVWSDDYVNVLSALWRSAGAIPGDR